jgi:hypothetical protein
MISQSLCVCESPSINFLTAGSAFMKFGMHITANEPFSTEHFINFSHQSLCLYVHPSIVARQRLEKKKRYRLKEYTHKNRIIFCAVRVVSNGRSRLVLHRIFCTVGYQVHSICNSCFPGLYNSADTS